MLPFGITQCEGQLLWLANLPKEEVRMTTRTDREVEFSVSYEGDALTQNTMDVRDLAPALLAL